MTNAIEYRGKCLGCQRAASSLEEDAPIVNDTGSFEQAPSSELMHIGLCVEEGGSGVCGDTCYCFYQCFSCGSVWVKTQDYLQGKTTVSYNLLTYDFDFEYFENTRQ